MSQRTMKACDWHDDDAVATSSYQLYNGNAKDKPVSLDLCPAHEQALLEIFKPHALSTEAPKDRPKRVWQPEPDKLQARKQRDRERHAKKRKLMPPSIHKGPGYWGPLEGKIMDVVRRVKTNLHINDISQAAGLTKATTANTLRRLVTRDLVTVTGGRGRWRRYHLSV